MHSQHSGPFCFYLRVYVKDVSSVSTVPKVPTEPESCHYYYESQFHINAKLNLFTRVKCRKIRFDSIKYNPINHRTCVRGVPVCVCPQVNKHTHTQTII